MYISIGIALISIIIVLFAWAASLRKRKAQPARAILSSLFVGAALFPLNNLLWVLSICPPANQPVNPVILGVGGLPYGLQFDHYAVCSLLFSGCGVCVALALLVASILTEGASYEPRSFPLDALVQIARPLVIASLCFSAVLFVAFFSTEGWGRIYYSDLGRFETAAAESSVLNSKVYIVVFMVLGALVSVGCGIRGIRMMSAIGLLLVSTIFLVFASRFLTVFAFFSVAFFLFSVRSGVRRVLMVLFIPFAVVAYVLPLNLRHQPGTGLYFAGRALGQIVSGEYRTPREILLMAMQNLSNGFPIFVDAYESEVQYNGVMSGVPVQYKILSFSPLPSAIDGYGSRYHEFRRMLNPVTPYNCISEMYSMNIALPFLVYSILGVAVFLAYDYWIPRGPLRFLWAVVLGVVWVFFMFYSQQYLIRGAMKMYYYGVGFVVVAAWIMARISTLRSARAHNAGALR